MSKDVECTYDQKYLLNTIISLSKKYDVWEVFNDFLIMCAYSISNSVNYNDARENEYLNIINRYTREEHVKVNIKMYKKLKIKMYKKCN